MFFIFKKMFQNTCCKWKFIALITVVVLSGVTFFCTFIGNSSNLSNSKKQQYFSISREKRELPNTSKSESIDNFMNATDNFNNSSMTLFISERDYFWKVFLDLFKFVDFKVDPCVDYNRFACGNWDLIDVIPKYKLSRDIFHYMKYDLNKKIKLLLDETIDDEDDNVTIKVKHFYYSCMKKDIIEDRKEIPLLSLLESLGGWPVITPNWNESKFDLVATIANLSLLDNNILISSLVSLSNEKDDEYFIFLDHSDLGMSAKKFESKSQTINIYYQLMLNLSTLLGADSEVAEKEMKDVLEFEIKLANIISVKDHEDNLSDFKMYDVNQLNILLPNINWSIYFQKIIPCEFNNSIPIVIMSWNYFVELNKLLSNSSSRTIANYVFWRIVKNTATYLDHRFIKIIQEYNKKISGKEIEHKRWSYCISYLNTKIDTVLGMMLIKKNKDVNNKIKKKVDNMLEQIKTAFFEKLFQAQWMTDKFKKFAYIKFNSLNKQIGYPDYIFNSSYINDEYFNYSVHPEKYFENAIAALKNNAIRNSNLLCRNLNDTKNLWTASPTKVNAYYSKNKNQITVPLGILQSPMFNLHYPQSKNLGSMGVIIGHEITHALDIEKSSDWWDENASISFDSKYECLQTQLKQFTTDDHAKNFAEESIADIGGMNLAFTVYKKWLLNQTNNEYFESFGVTQDEIFFLSYAQMWCGSAKSQFSNQLRKRNKLRMLIPLMNSPEFSKVYNCSTNSPMNPGEKCSLW